LADPYKTGASPSSWRRETNVSGWRRQGLGSREFSEFLKRSDTSIGPSAMPGGMTKFQGVLVKKTMFRVAAGASALAAVLMAGGAWRIR
jgi:hypothetical protein